MRGKPRLSDGRRLWGRLIPAHAGKTRAPIPIDSRSAAHPRACGENLDLPLSVNLDPGSSPRMRGKPAGMPKRQGARRLIPAHAGKTGGGVGGGVLGAAHPRACGENKTSSFAVGISSGSSPRMRGKRPGRYHDLIDRRLIPAHAGKTFRRWETKATGGAHPRACGENPVRLCRGWACLGSSPRMRGKRSVRIASSKRAGLIPAHAGKTSMPRLLLVEPRAHPRACGENTCRSRVLARTRGSSPRMRGKPRQAIERTRVNRLIPAHAGKTNSPKTQ